MKRVFVLLSALVLVAGCSDSDTTPAANDDNRAQFTANLLSANEVPPIPNPAEAGASTQAVVHGRSMDSSPRPFDTWAVQRAPSQ